MKRLFTALFYAYLVMIGSFLVILLNIALVTFIMSHVQILSLFIFAYVLLSFILYIINIGDD